jgi:hypothetical protein
LKSRRSDAGFANQVLHHGGWFALTDLIHPVGKAFMDNPCVKESDKLILKNNPLAPYVLPKVDAGHYTAVDKLHLKVLLIPPLVVGGLGKLN